MAAISQLQWRHLATCWSRRLTELTLFVGNGLNLIAEYDASNTLLRRYVHGPGVDEPIVWYDGGGTLDRRFLQSDERGSVISVSDAGGNSLARNSYDEYGIPAHPTRVGSSTPARPGCRSSACTTTRPASTRRR